MSHLYPRARRLALAGATVLTAAAVVTPAHAATRTLDYRCKYPLIGTQPIKLAITAASPIDAEVGEPTGPVDVSVVATTGGFTSAGLELIDGLKTIDGTIKLDSTLYVSALEQAIKLRVPLTLERFDRGPGQAPPLPDPILFRAAGQVPSVEIDAAGPADLSVDLLTMNLTARDLDGLPIILPPITKNLDGVPVYDSDGDPETFDVYCKLETGQADTDYVTYNVGGPLPTTPDTTPPSSPGTPTTSDLGPTSVKLTWGASTDGPDGSGLKRYIIRFGAREVPVGPGVTTSVVTGLNPNQSYDFSVVAVDRAGNESAPANVSVTTPPVPNGAPSAPSNLTGSASGNTVSLSWLASYDDTGIEGYEVFRDDVKVATVTGTSASISGVPDGTYLFKVRAFDADGLRSAASSTVVQVGGGSNPSTSTYRCKYPLIGVQALSLRLSVDAPSYWETNVPTDQMPVEADLTLHGNTAAGFGLIEGFSSLEGVSTVGTGVTVPGGVPKFTVNLPLGLDTYTAPAPLPNPIELHATGSFPSLTIDDPGVARAEVERLALNLRMRDASGQAIVLPRVTADLDGQPTADSDGDPETFDVYCKLDAGQQIITAFELDVITPGGTDTIAPSRPGEGVFTIADFTPTSINLKWTESFDNGGGSGLKEYLVVCDDREFRVPAGTLSKLITGLAPDSEYFCLVTAIDNAGNQSEPLELFVITPTYASDPLPPSNPTVTCSSMTSTSIVLTWTAATDNVGVVGYDVYNGTTLVASVTGTTATITGLVSNTSYSFKVVAKDAAGNKSSGGIVACRWMPPPPPVTTFPYRYSLVGSAGIATLSKGTIPLRGSITAQLILATGAVSADLTLDQTQGRLTALGFLPVTAKIGFVPSGKTTGTLLDGVLKTNSKVRIKVQEVKLFGAIPLAGGNNCQTKQLSDINLKSTQAEFRPLDGGPLAGTFKISDLNGCGALNGLVSPLTAGGGNAIALNLTPKN